VQVFHRRSATSTSRTSLVGALRGQAAYQGRGAAADGGELRQAAGTAAPERLTVQTAADGALSLAAGYTDVMTETPPTKPRPPSLRERLKLPDNCVDVTDQHVGERLVISATATA